MAKDLFRHFGVPPTFLFRRTKRTFCYIFARHHHSSLPSTPPITSPSVVRSLGRIKWRVERRGEVSPLQKTISPQREHSVSKKQFHYFSSTVLPTDGRGFVYHCRSMRYQTDTAEELTKRCTKFLPCRTVIKTVTGFFSEPFFNRFMENNLFDIGGIEIFSDQIIYLLLNRI